MRILQLIDTLEAGGAERMAVNYANELLNEIEFSALIATRKEGDLKAKLSEKVEYLFLEKKGKIDFKALFKIIKFVKKYRITHIHAHSSSFFLACLVKIFIWNVKIIWHDHYGNSEFLDNRPKIILKICSPLFYVIISVNEKLEKWCKEKLNCKKVYNLFNFPVLDKDEQITKLKTKSGLVITTLANLRPQKNIEMLIQIANSIVNKSPETTFHVIGKKFNDVYQRKIESMIVEFKLEQNFHLYDSCSDVYNILKQTNIGLLTSKSEGLPVSLLEMGLCKLPIISTNVGQIDSVISTYQTGVLCESENNVQICNELEKLMNDIELQKKYGNNLYLHINKRFSANIVLNNYLNIINDSITR